LPYSERILKGPARYTGRRSGTCSRLALLSEKTGGKRMQKGEKKGARRKTGDWGLFRDGENRKIRRKKPRSRPEKNFEGKKIPPRATFSSKKRLRRKERSRRQLGTPAGTFEQGRKKLKKKRALWPRQGTPPGRNRKRSPLGSRLVQLSDGFSEREGDTNAAHETPKFGWDKMGGKTRR